MSTNGATFTTEQWKLTEITPYERNARKIPQSAIDKTAASIREYGWQQPIVVDEKGIIIAGHTRLLAAQQLGHDTAPVKIAHGLSEAQAKAYRLMDNRSHEEATWDYSLLSLELEELRDIEFPLELTGFDLDQTEMFLHGDWSPTDGGSIADAAPKAPGFSVRLTREQHDLLKRAMKRLGSTTEAVCIEALSRKLLAEGRA
jgi:hypothetical protein